MRCELMFITRKQNFSFWGNNSGEPPNDSPEKSCTDVIPFLLNGLEVDFQGRIVLGVVEEIKVIMRISSPPVVRIFLTRVA